MPTLSIIIINYNVKEFLEQCLLSVIKAAHDISHEIFIVDNASTDGSVEFIRQKFPDVTIIANKKNVGFAAANNQALKSANGKYVLILNPDTVIQEDTFSVILNYFEENSDCGLIGCKIINPDGSLQLACRRSFPTPWVSFTRISGLSRLFPQSLFFGKYNLTYRDPDETYEVEAISGSFMFARKKAIADVDCFDESFFMYGEDLDLCYRIHNAGWKIVYLPKTKIIHFKGESSKKSQIDLTIQFYKAMKLFVEKHYHSRYFYVPQWFLVSGIFLRAGFSLSGKFFHFIYPAIVDLLFMNTSLVLAILIRFNSLEHWKSYIVINCIYSIIWLSCLSLAGVYGRKKYFSMRAALGVVSGFILNASITFFFNQYAFSRAVVIISGFFNIILISGWRFVLKLLPRLGLISTKDPAGRKLLGRRTLIVGTGTEALEIVDKLRERVDGGYQVIGLISLTNKDTQREYSGIHVLGAIDDLNQIIGQERIQEVIFSTENISYDDIFEIMTRTRRKGINFKLVPRSMEVIIGKASIDRIDSLPFVDIDYSIDRPLSIFIKRNTDIIISLMVIFFTAPIFLWIRFYKKAKLIKKKYVSFNSQYMEVYEFLQQQDIGVSWLLLLPRFLSVLKGDISIVGSELTEYKENNSPAKSIALKPGLVGLVQLNKRSRLTEKDKQRYDLFYLKNFTPLLDFEIILKSIFKI